MIVETDDLVVLLDEHDSPAGQAPRLTVHTADTPRHLAFSCYLFDGHGRVLMTRRALTKSTWPGVWTNSCCGHPRPGEAAESAVRRRVRQELGADIDGLELVLPGFGYRAVDASGIVENEACPVWIARLAGPLEPDEAEVGATDWVAWDDLVQLADAAPALISPWCALQVPLIDAQVRQAGAA